LVQGVWWLGALGLQPVLEPHAKLDSPSANALQLYKMKLLFVIFLFKKFVLSKNLCIFAATELVCIPLELQASHFLYKEKSFFSSLMSLWSHFLITLWYLAF